MSRGSHTEDIASDARHWATAALKMSVCNKSSLYLACANSPRRARVVNRALLRSISQRLPSSFHAPPFILPSTMFHNAPRMNSRSNLTRSFVSKSPFPTSNTFASSRRKSKLTKLGLSSPSRRKHSQFFGCATSLFFILLVNESETTNLFFVVTSLEDCILCSTKQPLHAERIYHALTIYLPSICGSIMAYVAQRVFY